MDAEPADEPLLRAELQRMIGNAYRRLAAYDDAEAMRVLDLVRARDATDHPSLARLEVDVARVLARAGDPRGSEALTRTSYERFRRLAGDDDVETAIVRGILGERLVDLGRAAEGRDEPLASREVPLATLGPDDVTLAARTNHLVRALAAEGTDASRAEAVAALDAALPVARAARVEDDARVREAQELRRRLAGPP